MSNDMALLDFTQRKDQKEEVQIDPALQRRAAEAQAIMPEGRVHHFAEEMDRIFKACGIDIGAGITYLFRLDRDDDDEFVIVDGGCGPGGLMIEELARHFMLIQKCYNYFRGRIKAIGIDLNITGHLSEEAWQRISYLNPDVSAEDAKKLLEARETKRTFRELREKAFKFLPLLNQTQQDLARGAMIKNIGNIDEVINNFYLIPELSKEAKKALDELKRETFIPRRESVLEETKRTRERFAQLRGGDICHLDLETNSVDVYINYNTLPYVSDPLLAIKEAYRTLRPGALGYLECPENELSFRPSFEEILKVTFGHLPKEKWPIIYRIFPNSKMRGLIVQKPKEGPDTIDFPFELQESLSRQQMLEITSSNPEEGQKKYQTQLEDPDMRFSQYFSYPIYKKKQDWTSFPETSISNPTEHPSTMEEILSKVEACLPEGSPIQQRTHQEKLAREKRKQKKAAEKMSRKKNRKNRK